MFRCTIPFLLLVLWAAPPAAAQGQRRLLPAVGPANDYTPAAQQRWLDVLLLDDAISAGKRKYEELPAREKGLLDSLEMGYGPMTLGLECSWYCGGQMYKVTAPSVLTREGSATYVADNIHDFNLFTAWVPDGAGGPIGKRVSFHFKPLSARVNQITVYNGYIKNIDLFRANGRVKRFRLLINNEFYGELLLADTTAAQTFSLPPLRSDAKGKDLVLTLEIAEVFPGSKYPHVAVSEINFSGLDVH